MGENLKTLMGDAYHEGMTVDEVDAFFGKGKYVDLNSGKYVDKSKHERVEQELASLKESTKDYETIKAENETFKSEKKDASLKETLVKFGVDPEAFKYVKGDIQDKVLVIGEDEEKNKKAVEDYLKAHPKFAKDSSGEGNGKKTKVVTTKVENQNNANEDSHQKVNNSIRRALGKKIDD